MRKVKKQRMKNQDLIRYLNALIHRHEGRCHRVLFKMMAVNSPSPEMVSRSNGRWLRRSSSKLRHLRSSALPNRRWLHDEISSRQHPTRWSPSFSPVNDRESSVEQYRRLIEIQLDPEESWMEENFKNLLVCETSSDDMVV